jgi:hypothetical protein
VARRADAPPLATGSRPAQLTLLLASAAGVAFSWIVARHSLIGGRWHFEALVAGWAVVWVVAARAAMAIPAPVSLLAVVTVAVALRLAAVAGTPSISNDLYRYAWDAQVQVSGTDPYRDPPNSPALDRLRTTAFWPGPARCIHLRMKPGCTVINRPGVRTIYPPVAEVWFVAVHALNPGDAGSRPWQLAGGAVDMATIALIAVGLAEGGHDPRAVAWYALSPLPVIEFVGNGHVDGLALLLLVAALLALARKRRALAGVLVGAAAMVKIYPAVALVALWRRGRWRMVLAAAATAAATELPHVLVVGGRIIGYLPGYFKEEHYGTGNRLLLIGLTGLGSKGQIALGGAVLAAVAVASYRRWTPSPVAATALLGAIILVVTPVQPWYAVTAFGLGSLADMAWWSLPALAAEPYYAAVILDAPRQMAVGRACYVLAALAIAALTSRRRRSLSLSR